MSDSGVSDERDASVGRRKTRRRIRWWGWTIVAVVVAVVVAGTIVWAHLAHADHAYGPIRAGTFGGEYSHRHIGNGPAATTYIDGPAGTEITRMYSLANDGSHSVKVTSIDADNAVTRVQWSPWHLLPAGSSYGKEVPARHFPATIPADSEIRVLITIGKPANCGANRGYAPVVSVHWDSPLHSHTTDIDFAHTDEDLFYLCKP